MKPLRALAGIGLLALVWLGVRVPDMRAELLAETAIAPRPKTSQWQAVVTATAAAPLVMAATSTPAHPALLGASRDRNALATQQLAFATADTADTSVAHHSTLHSGWQLAVLRSDGWTFPAQAHATRAPPHRHAPATADTLATDAYDALVLGRRRVAATGFAAAISADPDDPRAATWAHERALLLRRWSGSAYIMARGGPADLSRAPLLGGGQSGAALAFTPDPLAAMPLALTLRGAVAHKGFGLDTASGQAAVGVRWQLLPGVALAAERRFGNGAGWSLRLAGGLDGHSGHLVWSGYGEAGLVGADPFAAAQGFAGWRLPLRGFEVQPGGGIWGGVQHSGGTASRLDIGPSLRVTHDGWPLTLAVDYRARVAGNALPDSGIAVTLSAGF